MPFLTPAEIKTHLYGPIVDEISRADATILQSAIDAAIAEVKGFLTAYDTEAIFVAEGDIGTTNAVFTVSLSAASGTDDAQRGAALGRQQTVEAVADAPALPAQPGRRQHHRADHGVQSRAVPAASDDGDFPFEINSFDHIFSSRFCVKP